MAGRRHRSRRPGHRRHPDQDQASTAGPARASPSGPSSLLRRVTVIISTGELSTAGGSGLPADTNLATVTAAIITAARQAADRAAGRAAADAAAGGCAHTQASPAYQVPARIREFINLRDLTCRFPTCRQPAQRCDADHTKPHDQGGPTCLCNLGSALPVPSSAQAASAMAPRPARTRQLHLDHPHRTHLQRPTRPASRLNALQPDLPLDATCGLPVRSGSGDASVRRSAAGQGAGHGYGKHLQLLRLRPDGLCGCQGRRGVAAHRPVHGLILPSTAGQRLTRCGLLSDPVQVSGRPGHDRGGDDLRFVVAVPLGEEFG